MGSDGGTKATRQTTTTTDNERLKTGNEYSPYKRYWKNFSPSKKTFHVGRYLTKKKL